MFENIKNIFKRNKKKELLKSSSKDTAKERLHLVLMQDRANVSADFLDLMREEIIEVIKKYIEIDEDAMDVRLGSETNEDGTQGAPALYANIPIINIKDETRKMSKVNQEKTIMTNDLNEKNKEDINKKEVSDSKEKIEHEKKTSNINENTKENKDNEKKKEKTKEIEDNEQKQANKNKEENRIESKPKKENTMKRNEQRKEKAVHSENKIEKEKKNEK